MNSAPISSAPEVRKGLEGVVVAETAIGDVDGKNCQLIYRGYPIDELVGKASYEEVAYLLLYGVLPTRGQLEEWTKQLAAARTPSTTLVTFLQSLPRSVDPMAALRTALSLLGSLDSEADDERLDALQRKAIRVIALTPPLVAMIGRLAQGQPVIPPHAQLSHIANFLFMLHGRELSAQETEALGAYFVLLAEHGFNASTFTARTVTGTRSDSYSAIVAAIGALKGPLHGAANRKAMEMLTEIGAPEQVEPYVQRTLADHKRFMGFGHRVYKGEDPRAKHLKAFAKQLGTAQGDLRWFLISERLQEAVWHAKQLYINVDFYSASLLHYLAIPTELFTTMFAAARMAGWSAHIIEQTLDNRLIRPLALYTGPRDLKWVPLDRRALS